MLWSREAREQGQVLDSALGCSFPQVPARDLPAEVGASLGELALSPILLRLMSPLCQVYLPLLPKRQGRKEMGELSRKKNLNLEKNSELSS